MLAVRELLGLEPVAGFYQPLRGDDLRARGVFVDAVPPLGAGASHDRDARSARGARRAARRRGRAGGRARRAAARRRAEPVPADLLARRLRLSGDLPQPMSVAPSLDPRLARRRASAGPPSSGGRSSAARATCCSTPAPAAARPRCSSSASSARCSRTASTSAAILTITFTEKAAAELRDRIRARLRELGADEAARATEGAFISTIHGFCARVLRAHALAAGLDPQFTVLDRYRSDPLAGRRPSTTRWTSWPRDGRRRRRPDRRPRRRARCASTILVGLRPAALGRRDAPAAATVSTAGRRRRRGALRAAAGAVAAELGAIAEPGARVVQALDRVAALPGAAARAIPPSVWPASLWRAQAAAQRGRALHRRLRGLPEALDAFRAACAARGRGPVRDLLDRLLAGFGERYERRKRGGLRPRLRGPRAC